MEQLTCFCPSCRRDFLVWLKEKYGAVDRLNEVWGRCYASFDEVELPLSRLIYGDFLDFREFHLDKMTAEANARLRLTKELDPAHPAYLHVVPNTSSIFNSLTGVDDYALAKECDVFASTCFAQPIWSVLTTSAGRGKPCCNAECHIGSGSTQMHQKQITTADLVKDLVPQIGMGLKGFLFWQYRPETLGNESPAWGVTKLDGSLGSVGRAAREFIGRLKPYLPLIEAYQPEAADAAVWKGRKNELLSYCIYGDLSRFARSSEAYVNALYYSGYNVRTVDDEQLENALDGVKLLILPCPYSADGKLADAVSRFVENGGTALIEAHFGGYDADRGRHSYRMPGLGLAERWGFEEAYTTSSYHLAGIAGNTASASEGLTDDAKKAADAYGLCGGKQFRVTTVYGDSLVGSERFACLSPGEDGEIIGTFNGVPCMIRKRFGKGVILCCGTDLGEGAEADNAAFVRFVDRAAAEAGAKKNPGSPLYGVRVDVISAASPLHDAAPISTASPLPGGMICVRNTLAEEVPLNFVEGWRPLFDPENRGKIRPDSAEIFVKDE